MTTESRSKKTPVGVYPRGWAYSDNPAYYISVDEARSMRKGGVWYSFHHGKDIAEAGESMRPIAEEKRHSGWKVVGQTARNAMRPGFPVWQLAR